MVNLREGFLSVTVEVVISEMEVSDNRAFLLQLKCGERAIAFSSEQQLVVPTEEARQFAVGALMEVAGRMIVKEFTQTPLIIEA